MSVDARIREGLTMIEKKLPTLDTVEGYEDLQHEVTRRSRRRRALVGVAAAAALVVTTGAVLLNQHHETKLEPAPSPSSTTFRSPVYGYSIVLPLGWTTVAATHVADDPKAPQGTVSDAIRVPGTDTTIGVEGLDLGRETFASWATKFHAQLLRDTSVPSGCDGGDPSTWRRLPIGNIDGYLLQRCNNALGIAPVGKRVYIFTWGNRTFVEGHHYPQSRFEPLLAGVTLPDAATANKPLWTSSSSQGG